MSMSLARRLPAAAAPASKPRVLAVILAALVASTVAASNPASAGVPVGAEAGALDRSFGVDGRVRTDFVGNGNHDVAYAVAVQADGKVVAAGSAGRPDGFWLLQIGLARYHRDGTLDTTFGAGGKAVTDIGGADSEARALHVQPDGKLLIAGTVFHHEGDQFVLARYRPDGSLDPSFGSGGMVITDFGANDRGQAMTVQPDGKVVVAGLSYRFVDERYIGMFAVARYHANGTPDRRFGQSGKVTTELAGTSGVHALIVQPDGRLVAAGGSLTGTNMDVTLVRYSRDGRLDRSFGTAGVVTTKVDSGSGNSLSRIAALTVRGGKLIAAGHAIAMWGLGDFAVARYHRDGRLDSSFGAGGTVTTDLAGGRDEANAMAWQRDGKLLIAGWASPSPLIWSSDFGLTRYHAR